MKKLLVFLALLLVPSILNAASAVPYVVNKGGMSTNQTTVNPTNVGVLTLTGTGAVSIANATGIWTATPFTYGTNFVDRSDPRWWGAVSGADSTVALSNWLANVDGQLNLPEGTWKTTRQLYGRNNQKIVGRGPNSIFQIATNNTDAVLVFAGKTNWTVDSIAFVGTGASAAGWPSNYNCIEVQNSTNGTIKNCSFTGYGFFGVHLDGANGCYLYNCTAGNTASTDTSNTNQTSGFGIYGTGINNVFERLVVRGNGTNAIGVCLLGLGGPCSSNTVLNCDIANVERYGILDYAGAGGSNTANVIKGNRIDYVTGSQTWPGGFKYAGTGIYLASSHGGTLEENTVTRCNIQTTDYSLTPGGIGLNDASARLVNNRIADCSWQGIYLLDLQGELSTNTATTIIGGTVKNCLEGLRITYYTNALVKGVAFEVNTNYHILLGGADGQPARNVTIEGCTIAGKGNGTTEGIHTTYAKGVKVTGNTISGNNIQVAIAAGGEEIEVFGNSLLGGARGVDIALGQTNAPHIGPNQIEGASNVGVNNAFASENIELQNIVSCVASYNGCTPTFSATNLVANVVTVTNTGTQTGLAFHAAGTANNPWDFGPGRTGYYDNYFVFAPGGTAKTLIYNDGQIFTDGAIQTLASPDNLKLRGLGAGGGLALNYGGGTGDVGMYSGTTLKTLFRGSDGFVGILTNNPQTALHVVGTVLANAFAGDGSGLTNLPSAGSSNITDSGYVAVARNLTVNTNLIVTNNGVSTVIASNTITSGAGNFSGNVTFGSNAVSHTDKDGYLQLGGQNGPHYTSDFGAWSASYGYNGLRIKDSLLYLGTSSGLYFSGNVNLGPVGAGTPSSSDSIVLKATGNLLFTTTSANFTGTLTATNGLYGPVDPNYSNVFSGTTYFTNNGVSTVISSNTFANGQLYPSNVFQINWTNGAALRVNNTNGTVRLNRMQLGEGYSRNNFTNAFDLLLSDDFVYVDSLGSGDWGIKFRGDLAPRFGDVFSFKANGASGRISIGSEQNSYFLVLQSGNKDVLSFDTAGVGTFKFNVLGAGTVTATNGFIGPVDQNYSNVFSGTTYFTNNGVSTVIASNTFANGALYPSNVFQVNWTNGSALELINTNGHALIPIRLTLGSYAKKPTEDSDTVLQMPNGKKIAFGYNSSSSESMYLFGFSGRLTLQNPGGTIFDIGPTTAKFNSTTTWLNGNATSTGTITATNGVVNVIKPTTYADFTCSTTNQVYICNGTNQIVTLFNANANPGVVYRFTTTNGFGSFIITNATGAQTIRDGRSLSLTNIGLSPVELVSDGNAWFLAGRAKLIFPNAQFSCSTNIPMTSANTPYPITFDSTDWNNSQGIVRLAGTNGLHSRMWMTNAGVYEFGPSIVYNSGGPTHTARFWFMAGGANGTATNVPASCTPIKVASGDLVTTTVPFVFNVAQGPMFVEMWAQSDNTGDAFQSGSASGNFPATPSVICPVKKISDPYP